MKLRLVSHSPDIETTIATSMKTTTSGAMPSTLFNRFKDRPEKVEDIVGRIELQHGNILEHNRLVWSLEAPRDMVLDVMLRTKYLNFTKLGNDRWVVSGNLRSVIELHITHRDDFTETLVETIMEASPRIYDFIRRSEK
ncbi:hypothetical protein HN807_05085 [Candidatus Bathyarchaeota archaeon]|jgi:hypothetical protein|nr:hypothetical protein [Candidatus Bathyarchaeota archaeon]MBT4320496.1 hypothetical protein [Candidatus Bathyarchaeota archaeon]MBT4424916.1 hypothetical protein [Candidatus Bathyarchaeota archaeon]MBT6605324.1 hypothetical protein [Candidatus Bathyarchaeota archaeon]MBT7186894.1 hypothetical protein [Candidatus Bathyarchaeota archaeon]